MHSQRARDMYCFRMTHEMFICDGTKSHAQYNVLTMYSEFDTRQQILNLSFCRCKCDDGSVIYLVWTMSAAWPHKTSSLMMARADVILKLPTYFYFVVNKYGWGRTAWFVVFTGMWRTPNKSCICFLPFIESHGSFLILQQPLLTITLCKQRLKRWRIYWFQVILLEWFGRNLSRLGYYKDIWALGESSR